MKELTEKEIEAMHNERYQRMVRLSFVEPPQYNFSRYIIWTLIFAGLFVFAMAYFKGF